MTRYSHRLTPLAGLGLLGSVGLVATPLLPWRSLTVDGVTTSKQAGVSTSWGREVLAIGVVCLILWVVRFIVGRDRGKYLPLALTEVPLLAFIPLVSFSSQTRQLGDWPVGVDASCGSLCSPWTTLGLSRKRLPDRIGANSRHGKEAFSASASVYDCGSSPILDLRSPFSSTRIGRGLGVSVEAVSDAVRTAHSADSAFRAFDACERTTDCSARLRRCGRRQWCVNKIELWLRDLSLPARWAVVSASSVGVVGAIVGLVIGLLTYAPTAPFALVELGLPAALAGGVLGLVASLVVMVGRRMKRSDP
jgi:hypothetical protein